MEAQPAGAQIGISHNLLCGGRAKAVCGNERAMNNAKTLARPRDLMGEDCRQVASDETLARRPVQQSVIAWPLISYLELAALPTAVPCFRLHARAVALERGLSALAENIELIVSELVTNAVRAAGHPREDCLADAVLRLWISSHLHSVLIRVWDRSSQMPVRRDPRPDEEGGRGLMLVDHLCSEWG